MMLTLPWWFPQVGQHRSRLGISAAPTTVPQLHNPRSTHLKLYNSIICVGSKSIYLLMDKKLHDQAQAQRTILKFSLSYIKRKKNFKMSYKTRCTITQRICNASRNNRSFILRSVLCIIVDSCIILTHYG